ncbi:hypothetical protein [Streptosporangium saharense]|uniref:Uncharacterized protein n=1 Tax=Streptosporangium saharense TaxID=1706840 RepID=A0A7W7QW95_9ACTN|nr:hypothetical protein [Streptosporangium saharense]MBB4920885.1 hypothetical protein [Streptosporangium saharense]
MANKTRSHDPGKKATGEWPGGEPNSVREAYDEQVEQHAVARRAQVIRTYRERVKGQ